FRAIGLENNPGECDNGETKGGASVLNKERVLLESGLSIIARCKTRTNDIWDAHYGAAAIAGVLWARDLQRETSELVLSEVEAMLAAHQPLFASPETDGAEQRLGYREAEPLILDALVRTLDGLHWVGHNCIYAAVGLLALKELDGASASDVFGLVSLIRAFERTIPGRSWIGYTAAEVKKLKVEEGIFPPVETPAQLSELILRELASHRVIYSAEAHHDLIGHMLTFSHALLILHELGHADVFRQALPSLLKLVLALRASRETMMGEGMAARLNSPVDRLPLLPASRSLWLPSEPEYWRCKDHSAEDWDYGHVFKFPFSFYSHASSASVCPPDAMDNFRFIIRG
ncbi:MAG: hypothetical protein K0Q63_2981, partial [Paenibacillus sp.]|nr:hypothetical protein [Paenibacillus sp.]